MRTGVPGVWEEVARGIKERTEKEKETGKSGQIEMERKQTKKKIGGKNLGTETQRPVMPAVKRQTARPLVKGR